MTKSERTKNFIIESMAEIFNKRGYAGTTMADVEIITGLSRGGIYGNFENKEVMALAVFDYNMGKLCNAIRDAMLVAHSYHDKIMVYAKVYKALYEDDFLLGGSPILNTATEADDTNSVLKEKAASASKNWQRCMMESIESGIESGEFKRGINIDQITFSILALIEGGLMLSRVAGDRSRMDQIMSTVEGMVNSIHA
ncbi:transcriptional regulator, TetR family [Chitinophaga sp. YR573]|uniref:TetR/AcrR family transcriptional regulator n=1 Tax=Chitinophaga sp. YR573 TaxID=1881040 RepID=UPI0008AB6306|nr:TetR/AcrR family transcriptional regulator [Chitinophaga sp. YR573]SEW46807.1 transcriptional regulator, TetR family [Chitinophaga sp. YR573]